MKRLILILILACCFFCGCKHDKGIILFNSQPITKENALDDAKHFQGGQRVYYLFIAPKRMDNEFVRVQIFKMTDKAHWGGYEVVRVKDFRLMKDQRYYHSDYFTLYEKGRYVLQVFSIDNLQTPLAFNDFYVK